MKTRLMLSFGMVALVGCGNGNGNGSGGGTGGEECSPSQARCGEACVDVLHDDEHCGSCGNACAQGTEVPTESRPALRGR